MGPLGELGALFNPGMRHEIEERASKANRREEEGNARDGDLRIDLASGVAVINISDRSTSAAEQAASAEPAHPKPAKPLGHQRAASGRRSAVGASGRTARSGDSVRSTDQARVKSAPSAGKDRSDDGPGGSDKPRTGQVPSSKASRAAR